MSHGRARRSNVILLLLGPACCIGLGCSSSGVRPFRFRQPGTRNVEGYSSKTAQPRNNISNPDDNLAAIAEFLERTAIYELPDSRPLALTSDRVTPGLRATPANRTLDPRQGKTDRDPPPGVLNHPGTVSANSQMVVLTPPKRHNAKVPPVIRSVSIAATPVSYTATVPAQPIQTTNQPLDMQLAASNDMETQLFSHLERQVRYARDFDSQWRLGMAQLAFGRNTEALQLSADLSQEATQLFSALMRAVTSVRAAIRNPVLPADEAVARVHDLQSFLSVRADPVISTVELCRRVVTFGVYDPLESSELVAGRITQAIVYVEVQNFQSEKLPNGQFRSALATRLEVLTADGQSVWVHEEPEIEDICRRRRMDFFVAQRITLPPTLAPGPYVLKALVEDRLSGRADEASHRFTLTSATSLAGTP